jgi:solute carrier family 25 protein 44
MDKKLSFIQTIEWDMLEKKKFFPLSIMSSLAIKTTFYPLTLVRIRLQVQRGNAIYSGTWDAFKKIYKYEGDVLVSNVNF